VFLEDGVTVFPGVIYREPTGSKVFGSPFSVSPAIVSIYFDQPMRLRLGVRADLAKSEIVTDVIEVTLDANRAVLTAAPLRIIGPASFRALLCGADGTSAFWKPLRVDHEHSAVAPGTTLIGTSDVSLRQVGAFEGTTTLGAESGAFGAHGALNRSTTLGSLADGHGRGSTVVGRGSFADESPDSPWVAGGTALGSRAATVGEAVAIGQHAIGESESLIIGSGALAAEGGVGIGAGVRPGELGIALGLDTGARSHGQPGSIGLGAQAQYGLPSSTNPADTAVMIGAHDPTRARAFPWSNPNASQSESPFDEYNPTMAFTGRTVQLQRHLEWLADIVGLQVSGDATLGGSGGLLGFYGAAPRTKAFLGDDEPSSGITALDNLIYALRDLGLIGYRTEASMVYRADDLAQIYRDGDPVTGWPERTGSDVARAVPGTPPIYRAATDEFNRQPSISLVNSIYLRSTRLPSMLRGANLLPSEKHFIVVAKHDHSRFGQSEGLLNLSYLDGSPSNDTVVLTGDGNDGERWQRGALSRYTADGLDQTSNLDARLPEPHAYAVTHATAWPHARPVIGGPRDTVAPADRWSGGIAEVVGMDTSWSTKDVANMATGLQFKYGIGQQRSALEDPAEDFILTQHDPANGTLVYWKRDYSDSYVGKVQGRAIRVPKSVIYVPFISIYISFNFFWFRGVLVGNWGNLGIQSDYEIAVSVKIGDLDEDGDIDVDVDFDVDTETHIGVFGFNNNFTWSMGQLSCDYGYKICRVRHRITKEIICISGEPPFRYADTDVKIYTVQSNGSPLLEATVPLWGDGTFRAWTRHPGHKVARIVERSTGNVLGTTEYQEKALPRTQLYATDDPEVSFAAKDKASPYEGALTVLSILEMDRSHLYRARHILSTLRLVTNDDGSLNQSYSAVIPAQTARPGGESPEIWGAAWTVLAALRYQEVTRDTQFLTWVRQLADFLVANPSSNTRQRVATYFALRNLAAVTGVTSYATAAQSVRTALLASSWVASPGRWKEAADVDAEALQATVMGGLFALAIGDWDKARASIQHLKRFRIKSVGISAPHYAGASGLIGYRPYADAGSAPHTNPPAVIDQEGTWLTTLFKMRFGEPIGDDIASLYRWGQTTISSDPTHQLYGAQFLRYSGNATTAPYNLRARPHLGVAAWGHLLANGARGLLLPDPAPLPVPSVPGLAITFVPSTGRYQLRYTWTADQSVPAVAYEAQIEVSTDGESTWSPAPGGSLSGFLAAVVDPAVGANGFSATWILPSPSNLASHYRVKLRLRNTAFGAWMTSLGRALPPTN
jgi:hypothetical protein